MKNTISVRANFDFKGQHFTPSMEVDLDEYSRSHEDLDSLYPLLANKNEIGHYSYEYEIMCSYDLEFSDATGLAINFVHDGKFDFLGFLQARGEAEILEKVATIARKHLSIDDLASKPELQTTLLESFRLGQQFPNL